MRCLISLQIKYQYTNLPELTTIGSYFHMKSVNKILVHIQIIFCKYIKPIFLASIS